MVPSRTSWPPMGCFPVLPVVALPARARPGDFLPFPFGPFGPLALWPFAFLPLVYARSGSVVLCVFPLLPQWVGISLLCGFYRDGS